MEAETKKYSVISGAGYSMDRSGEDLYTAGRGDEGAYVIEA
jgi:hypothetical protein